MSERPRKKPAEPPTPARPPIAITLPPPLQPPPDFLAAAAALGVEFDTGDLDRLGRYLAMLLEANRSMNLTAITDPDEAWRRHILDSLSLLPFLAELPEGAAVIDVGSGGGLPGMPLAAVLPRLRFTLLEATGKKADFLRAAAALLGLSNVTVLHARAEAAAHDRGERVSSAGRTRREGGCREAFDAALARAVGRLNTLAELVIPFVKVGGFALLIKGEKAEEEIQEARGALERLKALFGGVYPMPTGRIVVLEKRSATPRDYPRRNGEPKRSPLR